MNKLIKRIILLSSILSAAGCTSNLNTDIDLQLSLHTDNIECLENDTLTNTIENKNTVKKEISEISDNPQITYVDVFDSFEKASVNLYNDILDFGVDANVYLYEVQNCYLLQANELISDTEVFEENSLVYTYTDNGSTNIKEAKADIETIYPVIQTVIVGDDKENIEYVHKWMDTPDIDKLSQRTYFSEKIGCDVDLYFGKYVEFNNEVSVSFVIIEQENATYKLAFDESEFETIADFEINVKKII